MKRLISTLACICVAGLLVFGCADEIQRPADLQSEGTPLLMMRAGGNLSGAIFTTTPDGGIVNENTHYQSKLEVYLDGGPGPNAPQMAAGLPEGLYVFQVTDPPGKVLLSEDPAKCRIVLIEDEVIKGLVKPSMLDDYGYPELTDSYTVGNGGNAQTYPCHIQNEPDGVAGASGRHDLNTDLDWGVNGAKVVQLMPFFDTPNPGGVYKAWVTPLDAYVAMGGVLDAVPTPQRVRGKVVGYAADPGFGPPRNMVKTDNFKVREQPPRLYVFKYEDLNGNGIHDAGEPELSGWKITVTEYLEDGTHVVNEYYTPVCVNLHPGVTVDVTEEMPADWAISYVRIDGAYEAMATATVSLSFEPGVESREVAFGNRECIDVEGWKYHDLDADGDQDASEPGLPGVEILLVGTNGLGAVVEMTTTTDEFGHFAFDCLEPGSYTVSEVCDGAWIQSEPAPIDGCGSGVYQLVDLQSGATPDPLVFLNFMLGELEVWKFFDRDLDGLRAAGEVLLEGFEFCLTDAQGALVSCQTTGPDGYARWTGLVPGSYTITETPQPGWFPTGDAEIIVALMSGETQELDVGNVANCVGLTPGYWKNWRNHYTPEQFMILLAGTIAGSIAEADFIFASYDASDPQDLTILKAFVLANQLTLALTQHPELPNPSGGSLFWRCTLRDDPDEMTLGSALERALEIIGGIYASNEEILHLKTVLDRYANQRWVVY